MKSPIEARQGLIQPTERGQRIAAAENCQRIIGRQAQCSIVARQGFRRSVEREIRVSLVGDRDGLVGIHGQGLRNQGEPRLGPAQLGLGHSHEVQSIRVVRIGLQNVGIQRGRLLRIAPGVQLDRALQFHLHPAVQYFRESRGSDTLIKPNDDMMTASGAPLPVAGRLRRAA